MHIGNFKSNTVRVEGGSYSPTMDIGIIECDTTVSPITIKLPNVFSSTKIAVVGAVATTMRWVASVDAIQTKIV